MKEQLIDIGLEEKEVDIYLQLLKKSNQTATIISKKTKINRTVVYSIIDKLIDKGLASYVLINGKKHFSASRPKTLQEFLRDKEKILEKILPDLESIKEDQNNPVEVEVFQGIKGGITILKDILREGKDYVSFGDDGTWFNISKTMVEQYLRQLVERGIKERVLMKKGARLAGDLRNSRIRYIPKDFCLNTITTIYGNQVAIAIFENPYYVILIKSKTLAQTYLDLFEQMWKIAKP